MHDLKELEVRAAEARAALPGVRRQQAETQMEHACLTDKLKTVQAQLHELCRSMGGLPPQPPVPHRMLFDCFAFKDPRDVLGKGLSLALEAIAGKPWFEHIFQVSAPSCRSCKASQSG